MDLEVEEGRRRPMTTKRARAGELACGLAFVVGETVVTSRRSSRRPVGQLPIEIQKSTWGLTIRSDR